MPLNVGVLSAAGLTVLLLLGVLEEPIGLGPVKPFRAGLLMLTALAEATCGSGDICRETKISIRLAYRMIMHWLHLGYILFMQSPS